MDLEDFLSEMCEDCHINPANVHLTHVEGNESETFHLCEDCARARGLPFPGGASLLHGLEALVGAGGAPFGLGDAKLKVTVKPVKAAARPREREPEPVKDIVCRGCGLAFSAFKSSGLLGCAECYGSFDEHVGKILFQLHGAGGHKGKRYGRARRPTAKDAGKHLEILRAELDSAVRNEEFETAARIRDMIRGQKAVLS